MKSKLVFLFSLLILFYGCEKNATSPDGNDEVQLSEEEQTDIIASEVAADNGGIMADVAMATAVSGGKFNGLAKAASYDTTFTLSWITYSLNLAFYTAHGVEQVFYVPNVTDKIVYNGSLTGQHETQIPQQKISLDRSTSFTITGITSETVTMNGSSSNNSSYDFSGRRIKLHVESQSSFAITDLTVDKNSETYIPQSGKLECTFHGTYTKEGVLQAKDVEYNFSVTIEFNGGSQVKVTLPSGNQITLDLVTGEVS